MNDAYRGALIAGSLIALYMAFMLSVKSLLQWKRARLRFVGQHVVFMTVALCVTVSIIIAQCVDESGVNKPLEWWDVARGLQVCLIGSGLRPLWDHQRQASNKKKANDEPV